MEVLLLLIRTSSKMYHKVSMALPVNTREILMGRRASQPDASQIGRQDDMRNQGQDSETLQSE